MQETVLSRKELYDLIWAEPLIKIAARYKISDNGLRKICTRMNIPVPKVGHWQKLMFGKKIQQPALPANYSGDNEVTLTERTEIEKDAIGEISPLKSLQYEIENTLKDYLEVPEKLTKPDKLVTAARESVNNNKWHQSGGIVSCLRGELDIRAEKANIPRVLRIMDALIKLLRARGHDVIVDDNSTFALVKNQKFDISLRERTKRVPGPDSLSSSEYLPTGILVLKIERIFHTKEWSDGKKKLEDQLSSILAKMEIDSDELNAEQVIRNKEREEREKQAVLRKEFQKRQEEELVAFKEIIQKAARWHKAVNLRNYIDTVEQKAFADNTISEELTNWLDWARKKADWYDPFIEKEDELLEDVDKENLTLPTKQNYSHW